MIIRAAQTQDAAAIADLWNAMICDTLATFTTEGKRVEDIAALITARNGAFWVLERETEVVGFATFGPFRSGPGYAATAEHTIILGQGTQGRGAGRLLLNHALAAAQATGVHVMVAGISSANPNAMAFHKKLGFDQTACMPEVGRKNGQWLDLILMQKTLTAP